MKHLFYIAFYKENYDNSVDLIANPNLLSTDKKIAVISALWFFKKVMDKISIDTDTTVKKITKIVNGGTNGLSDRESIKNSTELNIDCV